MDKKLYSQFIELPIIKFIEKLFVNKLIVNLSTNLIRR